MTSPRRGRRVLVLGGDPRGARQAAIVARALARGALPATEIWVVDRDPACVASAPPSGRTWRTVAVDWEEFLASYLAAWPEGAGAREEDLVVPSSPAAQLFPRWLARALAPGVQLEEIPPPTLPELPLAESRGPRVALSFADWPCPPDCIEPATCPATRQPRSWDLARALVSYARSLRAAGVEPLIGPLGGRVMHVAGGVRAQPLMDWAHAARRVRAALEGRGGHGGPRELYVLAGSGSACHGEAALLRATPDGIRSPA